MGQTDLHLKSGGLVFDTTFDDDDQEARRKAFDTVVFILGPGTGGPGMSSPPSISGRRRRGRPARPTPDEAPTKGRGPEEPQ